MENKFFTIFLHERHAINTSLMISKMILISFLLILSYWKMQFFIYLLSVYSVIFFIINIFISYKAKYVHLLIIVKYYINLFAILILFCSFLFISESLLYKSFIQLCTINLFVFALSSTLLFTISINIPWIYKKLINSENLIKTTFSYKTKFTLCITINLILIYWFSPYIYNNNLDIEINFNSLSLLIISPILISFINALIFPYISKDITIKTKRIIPSYINLDYEDIINNKLYFEGSEIAKNYRVFKIDFSEILSETRIEETFISNLNYIYTTNKITNNNYIYFAKNNNGSNDYIMIKLIIKVKSKKMKRKLNLIIDFRQMKKELSVTNTEIIESYKTIIPFHLSKRILKNQKPCPKEFYHSLLYNNYQNDMEFIKDKFSKATIESIQYDERKWILHNANFGKGKSVADLSYAEKLNMVPIIISAYEIRSKNDFLYSLYKTVYESVYYPSIKYSRSTFIYYLLILFSIYTVLLNSHKILTSLFYPADFFETATLFINNTFSFVLFNKIEPKHLILLILVIVLPSIIYILVKKILPYIIIFKNNSSYYYQDFFIREITRMLKRNKAILIIEDIDRLINKDEIEGIFATLSLLNSYNSTKSDVLGILSFDKKRMKNLTSDAFMHNIENKLISLSLNSDYNDKSIHFYIEAAKGLFKSLYGLNDTRITSKDFRSAHSDINKEIKSLELLKKEKEKNINGIKVM